MVKGTPRSPPPAPSTSPAPPASPVGNALRSLGTRSLSLAPLGDRGPHKPVPPGVTQPSMGAKQDGHSPPCPSGAGKQRPGVLHPKKKLGAGYLVGFDGVQVDVGVARGRVDAVLADVLVGVVRGGLRKVLIDAFPGREGTTLGATAGTRPLFGHPTEETEILIWDQPSRAGGGLSPLGQHLQRGGPGRPPPHHPRRVEGGQEAPGHAGAQRPEGLRRKRGKRDGAGERDGAGATQPVGAAGRRRGAAGLGRR